MLFDSIVPAPPDPILGLTEDFKKDPRPTKVNLGVGVFVDDDGKTPVLECVRQAEQRIVTHRSTKSYLPIGGHPEYARLVQTLVVGEETLARRQDCFHTAHTPGGTGALRVGADLLKKFRPESTVWISDPSWPNHKGIFSAAGLKTSVYPYFDAATRRVMFDQMMDTLRKVPENDAVLLHVCCHNPTGVDMTDQQWNTLAELAVQRGWLPFFDFAYQGFGAGLTEDRLGMRCFLERGMEIMVASSFSKNFGLYQDRVGALTLAARTPDAIEAAFSQVKVCIRSMYSNPAAHGGEIVMQVMGDDGLHTLWLKELTAMRERIAKVRHQLVDALKDMQAPMDFAFIKDQKGMFSFSGLSQTQVEWLKREKAIYMAGGGRINVAGISCKNLDYVARGIVEAMKAKI